LISWIDLVASLGWPEGAVDTRVEWLAWDGPEYASDVLTVPT